MMTQEQVNVLFDSMREFYRTNGNSPLPERHLNVIEIKAGIDLDRAIAGVIGLICTQRVLGSDIEFYADPRAPREVPRTFNPSIDLNDAFYAAERAGMFLELQRLSSGWMASTHAMNGESVTAETPALAICAAILKLEALKRT